MIKSDIVNALRHNDEEAFNFVYQAYYHPVFRFILSIVKNTETAEDLVIETFMKMIENINVLRVNKKFNNYLFKIAKNLALNELKRQKPLTLNTLETNFGHDDAYLITFNDLNDYLSPLESQIVTYCLVYELTISETSKILLLSPSKVFRTYKEALKKIKDYYEEDEQ